MSCVTWYSQTFKETAALHPGVLVSIKGDDVKEANNTVLGSSWMLNKWQPLLLTKSHRETAKATQLHLYI
jgi:hypothetical protein